MSFLETLFGKKEGPVEAEKRKRWMDGHAHFKQAKLHYIHKEPLKSIQTANLAFACGFTTPELYAIRGSALQQLEWHYDAIDDFDKLCALEPEDCNNFFQRAMSKVSVGDQVGFLKDVEEAIRLSQIDSPSTRFHNAGAREMGRDSVTTMYQFQLRMGSDMPDFVRQKRKEAAEKRGRIGNSGL